MTNPAYPAEDLRSVDRELLAAMRGVEPVGVGKLMDQLGVTATAVRQRLERLLEMGLIEREKVVAGRGRPTYQYRLTVIGQRRAGANPTEIADAMWREILAIPDAKTRNHVITAVATRIGREYAAQLSSIEDEDSFATRMQKLSEVMATQQITTEVSQSGELPVLDFCVCPYPSLTDTSDNRSMCHLEEQMISEALGQKVELSRCRLDGDACCQFAAVGQVPSTDS